MSVTATIVTIGPKGNKMAFLDHTIDEAFERYPYKDGKSKLWFEQQGQIIEFCVVDGTFWVSEAQES